MEEDDHPLVDEYYSDDSDDLSLELEERRVRNMGLVAKMRSQSLMKSKSVSPKSSDISLSDSSNGSTPVVIATIPPKVPTRKPYKKPIITKSLKKKPISSLNLINAVNFGPKLAPPTTAKRGRGRPKLRSTPSPIRSTSPETKSSVSLTPEPEQIQYPPSTVICKPVSLSNLHDFDIVAEYSDLSSVSLSP